MKRTGYPRTQVVTPPRTMAFPGFWQLRGISWSCIVPCRQSPFSSLVSSQSWGCASSYKQASYPPLASDCDILQKSTWNESFVSMAISSLVLVFLNFYTQNPSYGSLRPFPWESKSRQNRTTVIVWSMSVSSLGARRTW